MSRREESLTSYKSKLESNSWFPASTKIISPKKPPSLVGTLILIPIAIALYSLGINESDRIVRSVVEEVAQEVLEDY